MSSAIGVGVSMRLVARNPCPKHKYAHWDGQNKEGKYDSRNSCKGELIGVTEHLMTDMALKAFAQFILTNILATAETITDTSGSGQSVIANDAIKITAGIPQVWIYAGSDVASAPAFTDYVLVSPISNVPAGTGIIIATIGAIASNTFTVTGMLTNGTAGNIVYGEVGIVIEEDANSWLFLITRDQTNGASGYTVSPAGTVSVTYTVTFT